MTVTGARNVDWEDLAVAPGSDGVASVWLADIGDNAAARDEVQVYRVPEPRVGRADRRRTITTREAERWRLRYPGGPVNAEGLAVAPDGTAYIVTKTTGGASVYRLPARPDPQRVQPLVRVATIPSIFLATGAAISADGSVFVVRTYTDAYVWRIRPGGLAAALRRPPTRVALPAQPQGEGVAVRGATLLIDSEGRHSQVYSVPLPVRATPEPAGTPTSRAPTARHDGGTTTTVVTTVAVAAFGVAIAGLVLWRRRR